MSTDISFLENYDTMDILTGYAVVPQAGGGTNCSEYELLTSNSLQLMPGITPFHALDLEGDNSVVSHLNALGYDTTASHTEFRHNYARGVAYPALGFDHAYFDTDFKDVEYYGTRNNPTDESAYKNLIRWYEEAPEDTPRFSYILTMQSHRYWEGNAPEYDYVHNSVDYGEYNELMNEYLSCIYLSDQSFKGLTDYFAQSDRPVIVCMVGDHCPDFASSITDDRYSQEETTLRLRKTPLMIWANFDLPEQDLGTMSMNMVIPTLLDLADVPLSPYYKYLLQVKEEAPILTSYGKYYDKDGNVHDYDTADTLVNNYFLLEYQNIMTTENRDVYLPAQ